MNTPEEAVEAAARAIEDQTSQWLYPVVGGNAHGIAAMALEAAEPYMLADARDAARRSRELARKLEAVTSIAVRLGASMQSDERELSEELYAAMGLT